jgi:hypothetical protein
MLPMACASVVGDNNNVGWKVGWGFQAHGGFPSNPWGSYAMNLSTTAYFVGNASGMDSPSELGKEIKLGYVGIGWQLNNIPSHYSHLETFEKLEAKNLKALRPDVKVSVLRNTEVATVFWDNAKAVMFDNTTQEYWTQCNGAPCKGTWASPAGNTVKYFFNFSNPALRDWWVYEYIGQAVNESLFDGVYFDCSCGSPPGVKSADADQFQADAQIAFDRALAIIKAAGKWSSAWNSNGAINKGNCKDMVQSWMKIGSNTSLSLQVLGEAFRKKNEALLDNGASPPPSGADANNTIAAFLIARGRSAMLELPVGGAYENMDKYILSPLLDADFGEPTGAGHEGAGGVFTREWTKATITLDCNTWTSSIAMRT